MKTTFRRFRNRVQIGNVGSRHCSRMNCFASKWERASSHVLRSHDFVNFRTRFTNVLIAVVWLWPQAMEYHEYKSERDDYLALEASWLCDGDHILEVGCRYGWISRALLESAKVRWVGIAPSESMSEYQPNPFVGSAYHLPSPGELGSLRVAGDGLFATVPLPTGRFCFPPKRTLPVVGSLDQWAVQRFAWLAYEVWFRAAKVTSPCRS